MSSSCMYKPNVCSENTEELKQNKKTPKLKTHKKTNQEPVRTTTTYKTTNFHQAHKTFMS